MYRRSGKLALLVEKTGDPILAHPCPVRTVIVARSWNTRVRYCVLRQWSTMAEGVSPWRIVQGVPPPPFSSSTRLYVHACDSLSLFLPDQRHGERGREGLGLVILSISQPLPLCHWRLSPFVSRQEEEEEENRCSPAKQRENWKMTRISNCSQDFDFRSLVSGVVQVSMHRIR